MSYSKTLSHKAQYSGGFKQVNGRSNNTAAYNHNYYQQNKELWKTKYGRSAKVSDDEKRKAEVTRNISQQEKDFLKDVDEYLKKSGRDPEEFLKSQDFRLTLAEFGGYDPDKIRGADVGYFTGNYRNYFGIKGEEDEYWESKTKGDLMTGGMPTSAKDAMTEAYVRKARQQSGVKPLNRGNRMGNGMPSNIKKKKVEHSDVSEGEYYAVSYSSDLSHHGILGQKWGIRRYRNPDGTLTPAGKKRYAALTRKDGSVDIVKKSPKVVAKKFKNNQRFWDKADEYAFAKTGELNKSEVGQKFGKYVDSGKYYNLGVNGYEIVSDDFEETLDAMSAMQKYSDEIRQIMKDSFEKNVDSLLDENGYKITEDGREFATEYIRNSDIYKLAGNADPVKTYNIYKRRSGN